MSITKLYVNNVEKEEEEEEKRQKEEEEEVEEEEEEEEKGEEEEEDSCNVFYVLTSEITHYHFHRVAGQIQSTLKGTGIKLHLLKEGVSKNSI